MRAFFVTYRPHILAALAITPFIVHLIWPELESFWFAVTAAICAECA
jgi:hypothetical protein